MVHWRTEWQTTSVFLPWEDHEHNLFNWLHKKTCHKNLPHQQASLACPLHLLKLSYINKATSCLSKKKKKRIYRIKGNFCFVYKPSNELWELSMNLSTVNQLFRFNQRPLDILMISWMADHPKSYHHRIYHAALGLFWSQDWHLGCCDIPSHPREVMGSLWPN